MSLWLPRLTQSERSIHLVFRPQVITLLRRSQPRLTLVMFSQHTSNLCVLHYDFRERWYCVKVKMLGEKGRSFRWIWRVGSGDIDFGVRKNGEMVGASWFFLIHIFLGPLLPSWKLFLWWHLRRSLQVFPTFRSTTEFHPEIGKLDCTETGTYTFSFDNSYGKVWSKEISYKIWLE